MDSPAYKYFFATLITANILNSNIVLLAPTLSVDEILNVLSILSLVQMILIKILLYHWNGSGYR